MAKLKAVLETLDGVDEGLHSYYEENGEGQFILSLSETTKHPVIGGLSGTIVKVRKELTEAKTALKAFEGIDPDEAVAAIAAQAEAGGEADAKLDALRTQLETKHTKELEKKDARIQKYADFIEGGIDSKLKSELSELGLVDGLQDAAVATIIRQFGPKTVEADDGFSHVFPTDANGNAMETGLSDFVKEWGKSDAAKAFLKADGTGGSDAPKGGGGGGGGGGKTVSRSDPVAFGRAADGIADGSITVVD